MHVVADVGTMMMVVVVGFVMRDLRHVAVLSANSFHGNTMFFSVISAVAEEFTNTHTFSVSRVLGPPYRTPLIKVLRLFFRSLVARN